jgi:hypothetical protein
VVAGGGGDGGKLIKPVVVVPGELASALGLIEIVEQHRGGLAEEVWGEADGSLEKAVGFVGIAVLGGKLASDEAGRAVVRSEPHALADERGAGVLVQHSEAELAFQSVRRTEEGTELADLGELVGNVCDDRLAAVGKQNLPGGGVGHAGHGTPPPEVEPVGVVNVLGLECDGLLGSGEEVGVLGIRRGGACFLDVVVELSGGGPPLLALMRGVGATQRPSAGDADAQQSECGHDVTRRGHARRGSDNDVWGLEARELDDESARDGGQTEHGGHMLAEIGHAVNGDGDQPERESERRGGERRAPTAADAND